MEDKVYLKKDEETLGDVLKRALRKVKQERAADFDPHWLHGLQHEGSENLAKTYDMQEAQ